MVESEDAEYSSGGLQHNDNCRIGWGAIMTRRRTLVAAGAALLGRAPAYAAGRATDARIAEIETAFEDYLLPRPIQVRRQGGGSRHAAQRALRGGDEGRKIGGRVRRHAAGQCVVVPVRTMTYDTTLGAMKELARRLGALTRGYKEYGHPIDINTRSSPSI